MQLTKLFNSSDLLVDFRPGDKWDAISQMLDHLCELGRIPADAADAAREAVLAQQLEEALPTTLGLRTPEKLPLATPPTTPF